MSNTKREPLLSDEELDRICEFHPYHARLYAKRSAMAVNALHAMAVNALHEAARAKDAELIQRLVDDLRLLRIEFGNSVGHTTEIGIASLSAAEAAGFKPSDQ
jgi:hypothetical protein